MKEMKTPYVSNLLGRGLLWIASRLGWVTFVEPSKPVDEHPPEDKESQDARLASADTCFDLGTEALRTRRCDHVFSVLVEEAKRLPETLCALATPEHFSGEGGSWRFRTRSLDLDKLALATTEQRNALLRVWVCSTLNNLYEVAGSAEEIAASYWVAYGDRGGTIAYYVGQYDPDHADSIPTTASRN